MHLKLHWQIAVAMLTGLVIGFVFKGLKTEVWIFNSILNGGIFPFVKFSGLNPLPEFIYQVLSSLGVIFIRLLRMIIVPLIFSSIVSGVASLGSAKKIGRLGAKTMTYYFFTSICAILIGLCLTNFISPGTGVNYERHAAGSVEELAANGSPWEIIIKMVPVNPVKAAAEGDMLGIIFFGLMLGITLASLNNKYSERVKDLVDALFEVMMKMTSFIILFAPLGVLGLIIKAVYTTGFGMFKAVSLYFVTIATGLSLHLLVVLPLIFFLLTRINPKKHFKSMATAMLTAFSTSSSNATLPVTINSVEKKCGISNKISGFVLPLGATINMDGTALYECAGVIFISQVLGFELTIYQQLIVVITALLASIGTAGIPSAGLVVIFIVTKAVGLNDSDVAVIIGLMLAVDRPLDMYRTLINVFSDSIGSVVIARSEGEKDLYPDH